MTIFFWGAAPLHIQHKYTKISVTKPKENDVVFLCFTLFTYHEEKSPRPPRICIINQILIRVWYPIVFENLDVRCSSISATLESVLIFKRRVHSSTTGVIRFADSGTWFALWSGAQKQSRTTHSPQKRVLKTDVNIKRPIWFEDQTNFDQDSKWGKRSRNHSLGLAVLGAILKKWNYLSIFIKYFAWLNLNFSKKPIPFLLSLKYCPPQIKHILGGVALVAKLTDRSTRRPFAPADVWLLTTPAESPEDISLMQSNEIGGCSTEMVMFDDRWMSVLEPEWCCSGCRTLCMVGF